MIHFHPRVWKGREAHEMQDILFDQRCIFINSQIEPDVTLAICQQIMTLDHSDHTKPIKLHLMSPGGSVYNAFAIIDVMKTVKSKVHTIVMGEAASAAALMLAAGERGHRSAMLNSRIMIHEVSSSVHGKFKEIENSYDEVKKLDTILNKMLANFTTKTPEDIEKYIRKDYYMSAEEAKNFGIVDKVVSWQTKK